MPGMLGVFGVHCQNIDTHSLIETIDPLSLCDVKKLNAHGAFLAVSSLKTNPLSNSKYYEDTN